MTTNYFSCDGAPSGLPGTLLHEIFSFGKDANLRIAASSSSGFAVDALPGTHADLIRIAAFAYAADQMVSRGGERDAHATAWRRNFHLSIPVAHPDIWSDSEIADSLSAALNFLTDDFWEFSFSQRPDHLRQLPVMQIEAGLDGYEPDVVIPFSGGLDSLSTTVEALESGRRPVLVSHAPAKNISAKQKDLRGFLNDRYSLLIPHFVFEIHRSGFDASDYSQRSRGFLYACLASALGDILQVSDVHFTDNGVISLNLPINGQVVGAMASRATHPRFLDLMNQLNDAVFSTPVSCSNPLAARTRPEAIATLLESGNGDLIEQTLSCAHSRNRTSAQPQCGVCSQCVDRRFAIAALEVTDLDPPERYEMDIFTDPLPEGTARNLAISYVRFARRVANLNDIAMLSEYPQLLDAIPLKGDQSIGALEPYCKMLRKHGQAVVRVLARLVTQASHDIAAGVLDSSSLVALAGTSPAAPVRLGGGDNWNALRAAPREAKGPLRVFCSYAHEDRQYLERLREYLKILQSEKLIEPWYDRLITGGQDWDEEIISKLKDSQIILLLTSVHFFSSDYCSGKEMELALQMSSSGSARAIPIRVKTHDLANTALAHLYWLPPGDKAISQRRRDDAWAEVDAGLRRVIREIDS